MKCCSYALVWHTPETFHSHRLGLCEKLSRRIIQTQQRDSRCSSCPVRNPLFSWSCGTTHPYVVLQKAFAWRALVSSRFSILTRSTPLNLSLRSRVKLRELKDWELILVVMSVSFRNLAIGIQNNRLYENHWRRMLEKPKLTAFVTLEHKSSQKQQVYL